MTDAERLACERLKRSSSLETEEQILEFVEAANALPESDDPEVLSTMLECLVDTEAGGVQFELIEACERFPNVIYVPTVLNKIEGVIAKGDDWGWMLFQSLLNSTECLELALREFERLPREKKSSLKALLEKLSERDQAYEEIASRFGMN